MNDSDVSAYFRLFNEIGLIGQLTRTLLEARLPPGFVTAQFSVLNHLVRLGDGRTPLAIAQAFQVPKNSMTHSLTVLEREGLIEIRKNPQDGRSKLVYLTDAGRRFREDAIASFAPDMSFRGVPSGFVRSCTISPSKPTTRQTILVNSRMVRSSPEPTLMCSSSE